MDLADEPDELAAAVLAEEERQLARVRRRQIIVQLCAANYLVQGAGVAPRRLRPTALDPGSDEATELCSEIMQTIADNLDAQLGELRAGWHGEAAQLPAPQSPREAERREADEALRRRQLDSEAARRTAAARQLYDVVAWMRPRIDPRAVNLWRIDSGDLAGRVCAIRELDRPPVAYVWFGGVLLAYDAPDRWLAIIADALAAGAEAERVLTLFRAARDHAMPPEAARLPEYLEYRALSELNAGAAATWDHPPDAYLSQFDPSEARIRSQH